MRNCDWLSPPPHLASLSIVGLVWFGFTEIVTLLKCVIRWLLVYSQSCAIVITVYFQNFHHLQKETLP